MFIDTENHLNSKLLKYLSLGKKPGTPVIAAPDSVRSPYMEQGSHPDIVQRVWDEIGGSLPMDCRCLVYGIPSLVQPKSGIVLAFSNGTQYNLRLAEQDYIAAISQNASTQMKWSNGTETDLVIEIDHYWIFGCWYKDELKWCLESYQQFG